MPRGWQLVWSREGRRERVGESRECGRTERAIEQSAEEQSAGEQRVRENRE